MTNYVENCETINERRYYGIYKRTSWLNPSEYRIDIENTSTRPRMRTCRIDLLRTDEYYNVHVNVKELLKAPTASHTVCEDLIFTKKDFIDLIKPELLPFIVDPLIVLIQIKNDCGNTNLYTQDKIVIPYDKTTLTTKYSFIIIDKASAMHLPNNKADNDFLALLKNKESESKMFDTLLRSGIDAILDKYGMIISEISEHRGVYFKDDMALLKFIRNAMEKTVLKELKEELGIEVKMNNRIRSARAGHTWFDLVTGDWIKKQASEK